MPSGFWIRQARSALLVLGMETVSVNPSNVFGSVLDDR